MVGMDSVLVPLNATLYQNSDIPEASRLSDSPVTVWSTFMVDAMNAMIRLMMAPVSMAAPIASMIEFVWKATRNATNELINMVPSIPRFITPARSETSSPTAPSNRGVAMRTVEARMLMMIVACERLVNMLNP